MALLLSVQRRSTMASKPLTITDFTPDMPVSWLAGNVTDAVVVKIGLTRVQIKDLATGRMPWANPVELVILKGDDHE
jgi:hypothetical protein